MDDTFKLERDAEDLTEAPKKPGRKPKDDSADMVATLIEQVARLQTQLDLMSTKPEVAQVDKDVITIDQTRPFSKTRTDTGGITYEQDGFLFDACMRRKK